jgi:hypothetical protein
VSDSLVDLVQAPGPAKVVDGTPLGGRHQPRAGVVRDAVARPLLERGDDGVLRQFLGEATSCSVGSGTGALWAEPRSTTDA